MLDDRLIVHNQRNKKRFDLKELLGPVICGVAVTYLLTAALLGLLAR
jgi:hypothetical protein